MHHFGATVVIPSFRGAAALSVTLESLAAQTLPPGRFELVVVVNGPEARRPESFEQLRRRFDRLDLRLIRTSTAGASLAWNLGIRAAGMEWLTFVDDDDTVMPGFLEALLDEAAAGVVPLTEIHDRRADGALDDATPLNTRIRAAAGTHIAAHHLPQALGFNASKLIPTRWARAARYETGLSNGQDIAFFGRLSLLHDVTFAVPARSAAAAYVRTLSAQSMSRQTASFDFSIEQRLDVIEAIERFRPGTLRRRRACADHLVAAQTHLMNRYLHDHPDEREAVIRAIRRRELPAFPYDALNRGTATRLFVTDSPGLDRRRIERWGRSTTDPFDVLVIDAPGRRDVTPADLGEAAELTARLIRVPAGVTRDVTGRAVSALEARRGPRPYSHVAAPRRRAVRRVASAITAAGLALGTRTIR